jgi:hypothetical protein
MSTTCASVMTNNYSIQVGNYDTKVQNKMSEINAYRNYINVKNTSNARWVSESNNLNTMYNEGNYVSETYNKNIPKQALDANNMNPVLINNRWNVSNWAKTHIANEGNLVQCRVRPGEGIGCCYSAANIDRICCSCNKSIFHCNSGGGCLNTCGDVSKISFTCNEYLRTNLFENEKQRAIQYLYDHTISPTHFESPVKIALDNYEREKNKFINTRDIDTIDVKCCQSMDFSNIEANKILIDANQNCNIK